MIIGLAIVLGLLSMVAYSFSNAFSLPLAKKWGPDQVIFSRGLTVSIVLMIACIPFYGHITHHWGSVWGALGLGIGGYIPVLAFTHGIKTSRIGIVAPVAASAPFVTVILAFLVLHSQIQPLQWLAIAVVTLANIGVSVNLLNWRSSNLLVLSSGIPFALIAAIGWGLFYFILIYPTHAIGPWLAALFAETGVTLAAGLHLQVAGRLQFRPALKPAIIINALAITVGTMAYTIGVHSYDQAIVITLSNSTAVISTLLGVVVFRERLRRPEIIAAAAIVSAVIVLSIT